MKNIEIIGKKIGKLIVTDEIKQTPKIKLYKCICDCGNIRYHTKQNLLKGTLISCGCYKKNSGGKENKNWRGYGELSRTFFNRIKQTAIKREIPFEVSIRYLGELYNNQNGKCAISGKKITMPLSQKEMRLFSYTSSLDRIDSSKDYVEGNVQWVHKTVNVMKNASSQSDFIQWCREIANFNQ